MERAAHFATILGVIIATSALIVGVWQFSETQELTRKNLQLQGQTLEHEQDMKAFEHFLKFNEEQRQLAGKPPARKGKDPADFWRRNALLSMTEAVFKLTRGDDGWKATVRWMLEVQEPFLVHDKFNCETFAPDFVVLMQRVANLQCE